MICYCDQQVGGFQLTIFHDVIPLPVSTGRIGSIPSELWTVTTLQTLDINGNFLTGTIPSGISAMTDLVNLYGGYNDRKWHQTMNESILV